MAMTTVRHFQRRRRGDGRNFSLEQIFEDVRARIGDSFELSVWIAPCTSGGIFRRLWIMLAAAFSQRDVNHVTGDINFATLLMRRRKTVLTILDCGVLERNRGFKRWLLRLFWFQLPVWRCRYVTVISESTRQRLLAEITCAADRIKVVPVAISSRFVQSPKQFDESKPLILQIGTAPNKNLSRIVEALAGLPCKFKIIGPLTASQRRHLVDFEIEFEQVQDLSSDDLVACYRECDMVVFASTHEGFGMPILEANATGRPVVTSTVTSMPEVAADAACLVDPFDVASIRAGIDKVIEDGEYRDQLIAKGYQNVTRFRGDEIARQYADVYSAITSG